MYEPSLVKFLALGNIVVISMFAFLKEIKEGIMPGGKIIVCSISEPFCPMKGVNSGINHRILIKN